MTENFFPEPPEAIDSRIREWSRTSDKAPSDFLEAEYRRSLNIWLVRGYTKRLGSDEHEGSFYAQWFERVRERIEWEFQAYFEREKIENSLRPKHWWQNVYAGCNAQIEHFLVDNGFAKAAETLGWTDPWRSVRGVEKSAVPEPIQRYLIGIGYLYPQGDTILVHPNVVRAQGDGLYQTTDSAFLTRDLIRCPHREADAKYRPDLLSEEEMWAYWSDLAALSIADLPEYIHYSAAHRWGTSECDTFVRWHLDVGRELVPQRYVELEPKIETYDWLIPDECPENPRWK